MPQVNQIYSLLNDINHQMYGDTAIQVNDLTSLVSMGQNVMSGSVDSFFKQLIDRVGKVIVRTLDLELEFPKLLVDEFSWGVAIQKLTVDPFDSSANTDWTVTDPGFTPTLLDGPIPTIHQTFFTGIDTFEIRRKFQDSKLYTAFTSPEAMGAFVDAIAKAMIDSMTISVNNLSRTAINNFIAEKIKASNGVINIADMYNAIYTSDPVTHFDDAMENKNFLTYSTKIIRKYLKYIQMPNVNYNVDGRVRATQRDNMHLFMLTDYVAALDVMMAGTWNTEYVDIYNFQEVGYWQGNFDGADVNELDTTSAIKVTPASEAGQLSPTDVEQTGIIAAMIDRQAVFTGINKRRSAAFYNPIDDLTVTKMSADLQYCNDLSENGLVFIAEPTPGP